VCDEHALKGKRSCLVTIMEENKRETDGRIRMV